MRCSFCHSDDTRVLDSRPIEDNSAIRRRRHCNGCVKRFTTFERVQLREMVVVKKGGHKEDFDRDKIARSLHIALRKRHLDHDQIEKLSSDIVRTLEQRGDAEIAVADIGNAVMEALATVDKIAYVRFASVYRDFQETSDFDAFIRETERMTANSPKAPKKPSKK